MQITSSKAIVLLKARISLIIYLKFYNLMESKSIIFTYALIIKVEPKFHFFKDFAVLSFRYELKAKY